MKKIGFIGIITFGIACLAIPLSIVLASGANSRGGSGTRPHYLLSGDKVTTINDEWFEYYDIGNNEYAVGLKDGKKGSKKGDGFVIDSIVNNHAVTGIWHNGFHGNPTTKITLPETLKTIDFEAFLYSGIQEITIPASVTRLGDSAFYASHVQTVIFNNVAGQSTDTTKACDCEVTSGSSSSGSGSSSSAESSSASSSASSSSASSSSVSSSASSSASSSGVSSASSGSGQASSSSSSSGGGSGIPTYLKTIPSFCFFKCQSLTSISFPSRLEEIEEEAFRGCSALSSDIFFQNIKVIRARAFEGCYKIPSVFIPSTMFEDSDGVGIEPHAFNYCHPDLVFTFSGDYDNNYQDIADWEANHENWGWYSDDGTNDYRNETNRKRTSGTIGYSNEWIYSVDQNNNITIAEYRGPTTRDKKNDQGQTETTSSSSTIVPKQTNITSITIPSTFKDFPNAKVRWINATALSKIQSQLTRLYLPSTLWIVDREMFDTKFPKLKVIADGSQCSADEDPNTHDDAIDGRERIDLHKLTELEFIGFRAFSLLPNSASIKSLHLPCAIRAIGDEAFCVYRDTSKHFMGLTSFQWDYDEEKSRLEVIGNDAFYKLGLHDNSTGLKHPEKSVWPNAKHFQADKLADLVFPKKFRYFAMLRCDIDHYNTNPDHPENPYYFGDFYDTEKRNRPGHTFVDCPLIRSAVFKGSMTPGETSDLIVPSLTFAYCHNLQTVIFEERNSHYITFHTQNGVYGEPAIGASSGSYQNDFRGEPALQTLVLPNKYTHLRIQHFAFQGNSRAAIYFTGSENQNLHPCIISCNNTNGRGHWPKFVNDDRTFKSGTDKIPDSSGKNASLDSENDGKTMQDIESWNQIGTEEKSKVSSNKIVYGYYFVPSDYNTYFLSQRLPPYYGVHFKGEINGVSVEAGDKESTNELVLDNDPNATGGRSKCAYVCHYDPTNGHTATMSKYLYNLDDVASGEDVTTAKVSAYVTAKHNDASFISKVTKIGESAFSAAFCDGKDRPPNGQKPANDLETVLLPDGITDIGDYAFMRAYRVNKISSYKTINNEDQIDDYAMPSELGTVGKYGLAFCGLTRVLKIPNECIFFENYHNPTPQGGGASDKSGSVFSNDIYLRKITFLDGNGDESTSSQYYKTTTYTSTEDDPLSTSNPKTKEVRTTALYSNNYSAVGCDYQYNKNKLLLVLFRTCGNNSDKLNGDSEDTELYIEKVNNKNVTRVMFKGMAINFDAQNELSTAPNSNPFLFGAYKMAMWIDKLEAGPADMSYVENQPLFSGIYDRGDNGNLSDNVIYLYSEIGAGSVPSYLKDAVKCDLKTVSGKLLEFPSYAFSGCEKLEKVILPNAYEGHTYLPAGIFLGVKNANLIYATEYTEATGTSQIGLLDLTGTGYTKIAKDTFKENTSLTKFVAPSIGTFVVEESAFYKCNKLTDVSFASVSTKLQLSKNAFNGTGLTEITASFWPTNSNTEVKIDKDGIFQDCKNLTSVSIPVKATGSIGKSCFAGCSALESVTVGNGTTDVNNSITSFSDTSFSGCTQLSNFDFAKFTALKTIGTKAFNSSGTLMDSGNVVIGSNLASSNDVLTIGAGAFSQCGITTIRIESNKVKLNSADAEGGAISSNSSLTTIIFESSTLDFAANACSNNSALVAVRFTSKGATWSTNSAGIFNNDGTNGSFVELQLPTGFNIFVGNSTKIIESDNAVKVYTYKTAAECFSETIGSWNDTGGAHTPDLYYFAESVTKLDQQGIITNSSFNSDYANFIFWGLDGEAAIALGKIVPANSDFSGSPRYVAFENGYIMFDDGTLFHGNFNQWNGSIIIDAKNGSAPTSQTYTPNSAANVNLGSDPTREGYTFTGYDVKQPSSGVSVSGNTLIIGANVSGQIVVEAQWSPITYTISYTIDGVTTSDTYTAETPSFTLTNPTKTGYTFSGWSGTGLTGNDNLNVNIYVGSTGDRAYTANWTRDTYYLIYDLDGGAVATANPSTYQIDTATITLNNPTKAGYSFTGWSGTGLTGDDNMTVTIPIGSIGNRSYVAHWGPITYTISYDLDDGVVATPNPINYTSETETFTLTNPTKTGYTFAGWSGTDLTGDDNMTVTIEEGSTGNRSYVAHWTPIPYSVTWMSEDGQTLLETDASVNYGTTPSYDGAAQTKAATAQYTYTFAGWSTEPNGGGTTYAAGSLPTVSGNTTYYAWFTSTVNKYTVTWKNADGTTLETDTNVEYGATPSYDGATPTKTADAQYTYTFDAWTPAVSSATGDAVYTATYTSTVNKYTVTFNANGHGTAPSSQNVDYGAKATEPSEPSATGYTFGGWYKEAGCTNAWDFSNDNVTGATTLYAKWTANTYTVIFDKNNNSATGTMADESFTYDAADNLTANGYSLTGYEFGGWATSANGDVVYADGEEVSNLTAAANGEVTLYAKWNLVAYLNGTGFASQTADWTAGSSNLLAYGADGVGKITIVTKPGTSPAIKVYSQAGTWYAADSTNGDAPNVSLDPGKIYTIFFYPDGTGGAGHQYITYEETPSAFRVDYGANSETFDWYATTESGVAMQLRADVTVTANTTLTFVRGTQTISVTVENGCDASSDGNGGAAIATAGQYSIFLKAKNDGTYAIWVDSVPTVHTFTITGNPGWLGDGNAVVFVHMWTNDGSDHDLGVWIPCEIGPVTDGATTLTFETDYTFSGFQFVRCVAGTETPNWSTTGDNTGRIYNKTGNYSFTTDTYTYSGYNAWSDHYPS